MLIQQQLKNSRKTLQNVEQKIEKLSLPKTSIFPNKISCFNRTFGSDNSHRNAVSLNQFIEFIDFNVNRVSTQFRSHSQPSTSRIILSE